MTLDDALTTLSTVCERGSVTAVSPVDALAAIRVLLAENERLGAVVSDIETLVTRYYSTKGTEYFYDVRGRELARVLNQQELASVTR